MRRLTKWELFWSGAESNVRKRAKARLERQEEIRRKKTLNQLLTFPDRLRDYLRQQAQLLITHLQAHDYKEGEWCHRFQDYPEWTGSYEIKTIDQPDGSVAVAYQLTLFKYKKYHYTARTEPDMREISSAEMEYLFKKYLIEAVATVSGAFAFDSQPLVPTRYMRDPFPDHSSLEDVFSGRLQYFPNGVRPTKPLETYSLESAGKLCQDSLSLQQEYQEWLQIKLIPQFDKIGRYLVDNELPDLVSRSQSKLLRNADGEMEGILPDTLSFKGMRYTTRFVTTGKQRVDLWVPFQDQYSDLAFSLWTPKELTHYVGTVICAVVQDYLQQIDPKWEVRYRNTKVSNRRQLTISLEFITTGT